MLNSAREVERFSDLHRWKEAPGLIVRSSIQEVQSGLTRHSGKRSNVHVTYTFMDDEKREHSASFQAVLPASDADSLGCGRGCKVLYSPSAAGQDNTLLIDGQAPVCGQCAAVRALFGAALVLYSAYMVIH